MDRGTTHRVGERFRLGRVLKASASGTVYVATEREGGREAVVKIIGLTAPLPSDAVRARFQRAVSLLGEVAHPALPKLHEVGWASASEAYLVTDLVDGEPLGATRLDASRVLGALMTVGGALDRLHNAGSAHLNVTPDNVLVAESGAVTLVGLGSGWLPGAITRSEFQAPELAAEPGPAQPWRADIFSFARTVCGALGLAAVPEGSERFIVELSSAIASRLVDPRRFREVLERSLNRQPEDRPSSLSEVLRVLTAAIGSDLLKPSAAGQPWAPPATGEEPLDQTVKIDLATVEKLRAERAAQATPDTAPTAAPAPEHAAEQPGEATVTFEKVTATPPSPDTGDAAPLERTTRIETAAARPVPGSAQTPGVTDSAGPSTGATGAVATKRSPDTSPIPLADVAVQMPAPPPQTAPATISTGPSGDAARGAEVPAVEEEAEPSPPAPEPPAPTGPTVAPRPARSFVSRPWLWAGFLASITAVAVAVWFAAAPGRTSETTADAGPTATAEPTEIAAVAPAALQLLDQAEAALSTGDATTAELTLATLDQAQIAALDRADRERVLAIRTAIAERRRWDNVRALDAALAAGDLQGIRGAVAGLAGDEQGPAQSQELQRKLSQARQIVALSDDLADATRRRRWGDVLTASQAVLKIVENCTEASTARSTAAAALESEADELANAGSFDAALARLATLRRLWPDRDGLAARTARVEASRQEVRSIRDRIASAEQAARQDRPDEGLDVLAGLPASGPSAAEVRALKARLQEQLARLDEGTPRVSPAPDSTMQYEKNQPAVIALRAEDDYRVQSVALFARRSGGTGYAQFIAVQEQPLTWVVRIPAAFHQNETVEFYVIAADPSGHRGELGNDAAPLELKRRRRGLFGR